MRRRPTLALLGALLLLVGSPAARADTAQDAEELVRQTWYEGIPYEETQRFDAGAVARLGAMLAEPSLAEHHANVLLALGMSGHPDAFALLEAYGRRTLSGEVDRPTFRARTRLALAMGHLARSDRRALRWLTRRAANPPATPAWHFRHQRGDALALLLDEQLLSGLALSGAPEAETALRRAADAPSGADAAQERLQRRAEQALRTHRRIVEEGPESLRGGPQR